MSSRDQILSDAKAKKPAATLLPGHLSFQSPPKDVLVEKFQEASRLNGGKTIVVKDRTEVAGYLADHLQKNLPIVSTVPEVHGNVDLLAITDPHELETVELAVLEGTWSAAENAAIWMPEENLVHRVLPFIAQHLAVVISSSHLLGDMHAVYAKIQVDAPGYGVFIAGPSKTADIEQSLVIGAHGPRSMTVFLVHDA
ncbi:putative L-lactate dehydrogenase [Lunatimonas lonarensis]|uniref:Putative L-lactate dehydrogenase n=1 Tax=Lunatimonas lonarensis TaxID=1232681 RepID=R7ZYI2_9BACT|nr:LUD domain-containing protein [Lunatimonas lonarensis]EON79119.1 putative L-lactate dehydrogenase [Lunatimonas lonarensis]